MLRPSRASRSIEPRHCLDLICRRSFLNAARMRLEGARRYALSFPPRRARFPQLLAVGSERISAQTMARQFLFSTCSNLFEHLAHRLPKHAAVAQGVKDVHITPNSARMVPPPHGTGKAGGG